MDNEAQQYVCTLDYEGAQARLPHSRALAARLRGRERLEGRLMLHFAGGQETVELVEQFVRDEKRCCSFFGFDIQPCEGEVVLRMSAPIQAAHMLDAAMDAFDPDREDEERMAVVTELTNSEDVFNVNRDPEERRQAAKRISNDR